MRALLNRLKYIFTADPAKTFFPITLLTMITYIMASLMYIIEKNNDSDHFGSIIRALWFSFVSVTTIGYGDITPASSIGRSVSGMFSLFGIICVAFLTANIIDMNNQYEETKSANKQKDKI